jgi:hypothetical protein
MIEPSGVLLLRFIFYKRMDSGVKSCVKGDGLEFRNYLRDKFPERDKNAYVSRVEFSNRTPCRFGIEYRV